MSGSLPPPPVSGVTELVDKYPVLSFILAYVVAISIVWFGKVFFAPIWFVLTYLTMGILVTHFVTRRLKWLDIASLDQVLWAKLALLIAWPVRIPILIIKIIGVRAL